MAMKKKFLGLALAAAVALPATGVYAYDVNPSADGKKQLLEMDKDETGEVTIPINGIVENKQGQVPDRIEVELPSKMSFVVDPNGNLPSTKYTIKNNSANVDIQLAVSSFKGGTTNTGDGSTGGIQLLSKSNFTGSGGADAKYRNQISLELSKIDASQSAIDLGDFRQLDPDAKKLGRINAQGTADLWLRGKAGTKASTGADSANTQTDVDSKGAQEDFELVFSISKVN